MHQVMLLANILKLTKKSFRKTFVFTVIGVMEKVLSQLHISNYYFNSCDQNQGIKISMKKFSFRNIQKLFVAVFIQDFNRKFQNTYFEEQSPLAMSGFL